MQKIIYNETPRFIGGVSFSPEQIIIISDES